MVRVLDRKLVRDLRHARGLLLGITGILALGVMCFVYMRATYWNLEYAKLEYYAQCRMADFWIDVKKAPVAELQRVAELSGVSDLRPRIQFFATVDLERVESPLNGLVLSLPDAPAPVINDIMLRRGSYFTNRRDNEVIVNDTFARKHGLQPGQTIHLVLNNRRQELTIVGTALSSEFVYLLAPGAISPDPERFGVFYLKQKYAEEIFDFDGAANQLVGRVTPEWRDRIEQLLGRAELLLAPYGVSSTTQLADQASNRYVSDEIRSLGVFATVMPAMFLAVAGTVMNVMMSRLIEQQRVAIGTLKALGYSDFDLFRHFLKFGSVVGLLGGLIGCLAGFFMAGWVITIYREFFEFPSLPNRFYLSIDTIGLVLSVVCAWVGSWHGALVALRLQPAESMRPAAPPHGGRILLERIRIFWSRLSFGWRLALRNIFRHRIRTAVGVFAATVGACLMMGGLIFSHSVRYLIAFHFEKVSRSDFDLVLEDERPLSVLNEVRWLPGVDYVEPTLAVAGTLRHGQHSHKATITGLTPEARLTMPRDKDGNWIKIPPSGLLVNRKMASLLNAHVGDTLTFRPATGLRREVEAPIVQIVDNYLGLAVYADLQHLSGLVGEEMAVSTVQLKADPDPEMRRELYRELKETPALSAVNDRKDAIRNLNETVVEMQGVFVALLTTFAGVIYCGSILTAALIGLAERQREVATLRVLGYTEGEIGRLFWRESILVTMTGAVLGLPCGYALASFTAAAYDTEMFRLPVLLTWKSLVLPLVWAVVFALAAHLLVRREIRKMNWLETLQAKE